MEARRTFNYYAGKFDLLVGLVSLGLASAILAVYTRKRNAQEGFPGSTKASVVMVLGILGMFRRSKSKTASATGQSEPRQTSRLSKQN